MQQLFWDIYNSVSQLAFSDLADVLEVIGFVLTAYIAWGLRNIRNNYIFRVRAPMFIKALSKHGSAYIAFGNNFDDSTQEIGVELGRIDARVGAIQKRLRGRAKKAAKQLRKDVKSYEANPTDRDKFYSVYQSLQRLLVEVEELKTELELE